MDPFAILGVSRAATHDEIKIAYRRRAMELHPDRNPDNPKAEEKFKELAEAFRIVMPMRPNAVVSRKLTQAEYERAYEQMTGMSA